MRFISSGDENFIEKLVAMANEHLEHEEPQMPAASAADEEEENLPPSSELLEVQITHRAQEIAKQKNGEPGNSLAMWLEAAKEILSDDSLDLPRRLET